MGTTESAVSRVTVAKYQKKILIPFNDAAAYNKYNNVYVVILY